MLLGWFDARRATEVAVTLADEFASATGSSSANRGTKTPESRKQEDALGEFLRRAEREVGALQLNFYKKAKLANSFKWRLLEKGIESSQAAEITQTLVMHLSMGRLVSGSGRNPSAAPATTAAVVKPQALLARAADYMAKSSYEDAISSYRELIKLTPRDAQAQNNLGAALCHLGRFQEAEPHFRAAIGIKPQSPDAHINLAAVLQRTGNLGAAENSLRRALKLKPGNVDARVSLGSTLLGLARLGDAKVQFEKVLALQPDHSGALLGIAQIANAEGRFDDAESLYTRILQTHPNSAEALAGLIGLRKMTPADSAWLKRAEDMAGVARDPTDETTLRFAIGKHCDDIGDFERAFKSYRRANEILKTNAQDYDRDAYALFIDDLIRIYTPAAIAQVGVGASASTKPVFVVGMPRSGTSLVEQIIASHPAAAGVGERDFWIASVKRRETAVRQAPLGESLRQELAAAYLQSLARNSTDAQRVVDKTPVNSDYLGVIHSVFPQARMIYVRRHPIDTCLSCYFQQFSTSQRFAMDLSDLAHYYRQHHRLVGHWRTVLPPGTLLDVPYEELVADQEAWTRRILEFLGLEWDERCLNFHNTQRTVATASAWQVRQRIYQGSVQRWRHYEKFIGPLRDLQALDR